MLHVLGTKEFDMVHVVGTEEFDMLVHWTKQLRIGLNDNNF